MLEQVVFYFFKPLLEVALQGETGFYAASKSGVYKVMNFTPGVFGKGRQQRMKIVKEAFVWEWTIGRGR